MANPAASLPDVALLLNNLDILYRHPQQQDTAEKCFQEAQAIREQLAANTVESVNRSGEGKTQGFEKSQRKGCSLAEKPAAPPDR